MDLDKAREIALTKLKEHKLDNWTIKFTSAQKRFGCCHYRKNQLTFSSVLVKLNDEFHFTQTVLHEVAHAKLGPYFKHNRIWLMTARAMGYKWGRTYPNTVIQPKSKWIGYCPKHLDRQHEYLRRRNLICLFCKREGIVTHFLYRRNI